MQDKRRYADRRQVLIKAVAKRRRKIKTFSLEYKGGKCQICGYNKHHGALEFHHLNKNEKSFGIGEKGYTRSWEKIKAELDKCVLLCANCHREVSDGVLQLPEVILVENEENSGKPSKVNYGGNPEPSPSPVLDLKFFKSKTGEGKV